MHFFQFLFYESVFENFLLKFDTNKNTNQKFKINRNKTMISYQSKQMGEIKACISTSHNSISFLLVVKPLCLAILKNKCRKNLTKYYIEHGN